MRLLRPLIQRSHKKKRFSWAEKNGKTPIATGKSVYRWKAVSRPVKLQKPPLNCMVLRNVMASLSLFVIKRQSKSLAFAASDSSRSLIKIAYPERNGMGKR